MTEKPIVRVRVVKFSIRDSVLPKREVLSDAINEDGDGRVEVRDWRSEVAGRSISVI